VIKEVWLARSSTCSTAAAATAGRSSCSPGVSTPLFHDKNTQHIGKSQSKRPHKMWKRPLTSAPCSMGSRWA
jgi:hypothetical protein